MHHSPAGIGMSSNSYAAAASTRSAPLGEPVLLQPRAIAGRMLSTLNKWRSALEAAEVEFIDDDDGTGAWRHAAGEKPDRSGQLGPKQDLRLLRPANSYSPSPFWRPLTGTLSLPGNSLVAGAPSAKCQVPSAGAVPRCAHNNHGKSDGDGSNGIILCIP